MSFIIKCRYCKSGVKITPLDLSITLKDVYDRLPDCDMCQNCRRHKALNPIHFDAIHNLNNDLDVSILSEL